MLTKYSSLLPFISNLPTLIPSLSYKISSTASPTTPSEEHEFKINILNSNLPFATKNVYYECKNGEACSSCNFCASHEDFDKAFDGKKYTKFCLTLSDSECPDGSSGELKENPLRVYIEIMYDVNTLLNWAAVTSGNDEQLR